MKINAQRTRRVNVRLTESEHAALMKKVADSGLTYSEFMRRAISGRRIVSRVDQNLINELRRLGGLLKHVHNESGGAYSAQTAAAIDDLREAIRRIEVDR